MCRCCSRLADTRPDESAFTKLDSSLKKCTAFVKKLRNVTESQEEALSRDIASLNLSKYIAEVVGFYRQFSTHGFYCQFSTHLQYYGLTSFRNLSSRLEHAM